MLLDNIKRYAKENKLTLEEIETTSGLGKKTLFRWNETKPAVDKVQAVAAVLGVTVDELLRDEQNERGA